MTRRAKSRSPAVTKERAPQRAAPKSVWILPSLLAFVLFLPCLGFTFIWDDFQFLREALSFHPRQLLPQAGQDFYRPISREIYFGLIVLLGAHKALLSHLINAAILIAGILIYTRFVSRIAGPRVALFAGAAFACLGQMPLLVGWVSGAQDLFAILFLTMALTFRWERREGAALAATAAALLSKETAAAFVPALILMNWVLDRRPFGLVAGTLRYGLLTAAWAAIHPGLRELLLSGFHQGATVYLGTASAQPPPLKFLQYLLVLFHLPVPGVGFGWPDSGWALFAIGALIAVALVRGAPPDARPEGIDARPTAPRVIAFAVLLTIPPLLLAAGLVRHWLPYYVVIAGLGAAILLAMPLARAPAAVAWAGLVAFLELGILSRGLAFPPTVATERNFRTTSETLSVVESGFRALYPTLPRGMQAVVSVQVSGGAAGVYRQFFVEQPLPVWYGDPTLSTLRAVEPRDPKRPEKLFVVLPWLDVAELDPDTYRARSSGRMPEYGNGERAIRLYAMGTFVSGDADRAVRILMNMPEVDPAVSNVHRRLASAFLDEEGRSREADSLRAPLRPLPRSYSLEGACGYLAESLRRSINEGILKAFSVSPGDTASMLGLVRCLKNRGNLTQALAVARRLRVERPQDPGALAAERWIEGEIRSKAEQSP